MFISLPVARKPAKHDVLPKAPIRPPSRAPTGLPLGLAIACLLMVGLDLRPGIASIGPLLPQLRSAFAISNAEVALLTAIPPFFMGLLALPTPWLAHRFGRNRMVIAALMLITLATALRALADSSTLLFLTTAAIGAGIAVAGALIGGFVKGSFPHHAALFMGLYAMSLGLGATLSAALTGPLTSLSHDWRIGAGIWALPGLTAIVAWLVIARGEAASAPSPVHGEAARAPQVRLPVGSGAAWRIALYFAANNIVFFGVLSWLVPLYLDRGRDPATAGLILTSFTVAFMIANPLPGLLGKARDRRPQIATAAAAILAGLLGVALHPSGMAFVFVPLLALGVGSSFTLGMTLPLDHAPVPHATNSWNAFVLAFGYGAGALGPLMVGLLHGVSGGFGLPLAFLAGAAALMLFLTPFLGGGRHGKATAR